MEIRELTAGGKLNKNPRTMPVRTANPWVLAAVIFAFAAADFRQSRAQEISGGIDPAIKDELEYAQTLHDWGLPEYAEMVLKRIDLASHPEAKPLLKVLQLKGHVMRGEWDKIKAIIDKEPDQKGQEAWAMRLAMADGYYAWGRYAEAQQIYNSFFAAHPQGPTPALNSFFVESAYKYAQMLLLMNKREEALKAYRLIAKGKMEQHVERQVQGETAELLVKLAEETQDPQQRKTYFKDIETILNKILWIQDLWFGKGIVMMAHVKMLEDDPDGATKLISEFDGQLNDIDRSLKEEEEKTGEPLSRLSPMAQCRYLVGVIRQQKAEKILADPAGDKGRAATLLGGDALAGGKRAKNGAIHEFYRVFLNYPNTAWAADAGKRAKQVEEMLVKEFKAEIKTNITPEKWDQVRDAQLQSARVLYNQQQYDKAAAAYLDALNAFPESEPAVVALGDLVRCYAELGEPVYAETTMRYLAERFCANRQFMIKAGDEVLRLAFGFDEQNRPSDRDMAHEVFFRFFGEHPRTPGLLMKFGDDQMAESNYFGALNYFVQVETNYPASEYVADAIGRIAACYSRLDDQTNEIVTLEQKYIPALLKKERPGHALIAGKYRLATAYRRKGDVTKAYVEYKDIIDRLTEKPQEYQASGQDADANKNVLEAALYYKALGLTRMNPPSGKDENFLRLLSVQSFLKLVEQFPKSPFAPAALSQVGTLYTVMEKAQEAEEALKRLQKEYPDSDEAKNSYFMLGMNLLKLGLRTRAIQVFKEMFSGTSGRYSAVQIITAGQLLLDEGEAEIALEAFERVLSSGESHRAVVEPAMLGKGRSQVALKRWEDAVKTLEDLLLKFPRSGFTVEASRLLSVAYSETAKLEPRLNERIEKFNQAVDSIHKAKRFERTPGGRALLDADAARLLARKVEAEVRHGSKERAAAFRGEAVAAYQSLMMFGDPANMEVRPHIEAAFNECIPLLLEMNAFQDALEDCGKYMELFPRGKHVLNIRNYENRARIGLVSAGGTQPAAGGGNGAQVAAPNEATPSGGPGRQEQ